MAKKFGIKKRIIHSHNSHLMEKGIRANIKKIIHFINRKDFLSMQRIIGLVQAMQQNGFI
ncbi:hypothetical protein AAULH_13521 [Lactobacillus helveticus MTCC 5463]|nr:hypothetical protein AAULH_13521 [Lactobacillus helveticus MTCC 5463]